MDTSQVLTIMLLCMAILAIASISWAFYLDGKYRNRPSPRHYSVHVEGTKVFTEQDISAARDEARQGLQKAVAESANLMRSMLSISAKGISTKADDMATNMLQKEFGIYQTSLSALREQTIKEYADLQKELDVKRAQMVAEMDERFKKNEAERMDAFNERIADVVSSYLTEALENGIDLGAQSKYIIHTLEAQKEAIKKDVLS